MQCSRYMVFITIFIIPLYRRGITRMSPETDLGALLDNDDSRIWFRWPELSVFRVSFKVY